MCACSATYCDTLDPVVLPAPGTYIKYESSKAGKRLERSQGSFQRNAKTPGTRRLDTCLHSGGQSLSLRRGCDHVCPLQISTSPWTRRSGTRR